MLSLLDYNHEYRLGVAQQRLVLHQVRDAAARVGHDPAVQAADHALPRVEAAARVERTYKRERGVRPDSKDAQDLARDLGDVVASIHGTLSGIARLGRRRAKGRLAAELLATVFPGLLRDHTLASYTEQLHLNTVVVGILRDPAHATFVAAIGMTDLVELLADLNARFQLLVAPEATVSAEQLRDARRHGEEALLRVVHQVLATFDPAVPDQVRVRDAILLPYLAMRDEIRAARQRRLAEAVRAKAQAGAARPGASAATPAPTATPAQAHAALATDAASAPEAALVGGHAPIDLELEITPESLHA